MKSVGGFEKKFINGARRMVLYRLFLLTLQLDPNWLQLKLEVLGRLNSLQDCTFNLAVWLTPGKE